MWDYNPDLTALYYRATLTRSAQRIKRMKMSEKSGKAVTRFHSKHGQSITLCDDRTVALRTCGYSNSVAFSEKPLQLGEIFLVEIEEIERGWSGHLRLGLTLTDPADINHDVPQYSITNLCRRNNTWLFAMTSSRSIWDCIEGDGVPSRQKRLITDGVNVQTSRGVIPYSMLMPNNMDPTDCILATSVGSRVGVMYVPQAGSDKAEMHFIVNGEDQGVVCEDIPYKLGPLRVIVDVYGSTGQVRIVQLYGGVSTLQSACRDVILRYTATSEVESLPLPRVLKDYLLYRSP